jgi:hypothetical protein
MLVRIAPSEPILTVGESAEEKQVAAKSTTKTSEP